MVGKHRHSQAGQLHITAFAPPMVGRIAFGAATFFAGIERGTKAAFLGVAQIPHFQAIIGARFLDLG